ncbi:preprotein translocase subunit TatA [Microaerobacter geothermalis]|uniref:preprotein translocase subunit TatA n=1 Tax=Microaerobacter geothermalis TaxID=674972 RepID=UPI001F1CB7DC|nr:preprotein translocase subunit TatA [Microaerobacter geothermalis]MCF6095114.1 preprotein translocase subunit TatA [Microaerobacter geothermalis]
MIHPVRECIAKIGLSQNSFAVLNAISVQRLRDCLYGYTESIPKKIVSILVQQGYDEQEVQQQYKQWRKWKAEQEFLNSPAAHEGRGA